MRRYVESLRDDGSLAALLDRIIAQPREHARMLNTLSRLEYVGVRKMLKTRRAERLNLDGLQHVLDETVHALRLKKAALALAGACETVESVATFSDADTLAGDAAENYLQGVDHAAEAARRRSIRFTSAACVSTVSRFRSPPSCVTRNVTWRR
jgi:hypothetical protein